MFSIDGCHLFDLPRHDDSRGTLVYANSCAHIPFEINRIYYIYDVPESFDRGAHAHKNLHQAIIPLNGSFTVAIDDGFKSKSFLLDNPSQALYICPMIWRVISNFSPGSICLVLASEHYSEDDYIRNYSDFAVKVKNV